MKVALIGCTKQKRKIKSRALDLYDVSPYFVKRRKYAERVIQAGGIFILSALHELLPAEQEVEPYNVCLKDLSRNARKIWAEHVLNQINSKLNKNDEIFILSGSDYSKDLYRLLISDGYKHVTQVLNGKGGIGSQMKWLDEEVAKTIMIPVKVGELRQIKKSETGIPDLPGVYKWWCTKETLQYFINEIASFSRTTGKAFTLNCNDIEEQIEHKFFEKYGHELYCFYVGKADSNHGLRDRIISNHIKGNVNGSTLRKSIYSLKFGDFDSHNETHKNNDRGYVNEILDAVYIEWQDYPQAQVHENEIREINSHLRIFNIDSGDLNDAKYPFDAELRHCILNNLSEARRKH